MLQFYLGTQYDPAHPMGNIAQAELGTVIKAWLVGLEKEVAPILPRSVEWLADAIERREKFGSEPNFHLKTLHWAKAIADWMDTGGNSAEWENARVFEEAAWRNEIRPWPTNEIIRDGLDDYMAFAYQTGDDATPDGMEGFENGIQMYEHWVNDKPPSLKKTLKPREYAYALCLYGARPEIADANAYTPEALFDAGRRMLKANLESKWFGAGQFIRGATWLKIVYWKGDGSLTPLQTILKAYDDMPNVKRPDFVVG
ncbi:hypothetical protein LFL97_22265 [Burkholderia sp. JSH-S8]|uniref:hypothetical protein n=1 Tax=Burkholderia stagnalis TaxID=1503054 RepID=UPI000F803071|nr:hypothetical protein [Burkholderia stagnalis]WGS45462.1 hypothetical protein LFL97_22265 [Burkholderia sp. JSH-S8]